jgi:site-specific DNA-methyltransferase (adenine-specific)
VDLLFLDPPYNLKKKFNDKYFGELTSDAYEAYLESWLPGMLRLLRPGASVYLCGDWRSSAACQRVLERYLKLRNRITWEREKGRGAKANWKNCTEDIWFSTYGDDYYFDVDAVKTKRRVIAPYRENGAPKDWEDTAYGQFRLTHPSNIWTDLTVPFWSMPENTDHPTQKPEKLMAKILLASTRPGAVVLDPFGGSGTTAVVARKLGRNFIAIERDTLYCLFAERRLEIASNDMEIQGYADGVFWDRNTGHLQEQQRNEATNPDKPIAKQKITLPAGAPPALPKELARVPKATAS